MGRLGAQLETQMASLLKEYRQAHGKENDEEFIAFVQKKDFVLARKPLKLLRKTLSAGN
jgi:hypothetical protein